MKGLVLSFLAVTLVVTGCAPATPTGGPSVAAEDRTRYANPDLLIETDQLASRLQHPRLRIVDLRSKEKYHAGHIPGAVWFDTALLKDPVDKLYAPSPANVAKIMGEHGIANETHVVAYDDQGGLWAARLWWVLDYYGHSNAQVLNGGWNKWAKEGRPIETEVPSVAPATFTPKLNDTVVCALDYVLNATKRSDVVIVDARTAAEYNGTDVRAARGGHIPNAVNIDWQRTVTNDDVRVWKPAAELRQLYEAAGVTPEKEVITYCQTAVRAAHTLFTLRLLGYKNVRTYDGSWAEYGNRPDTPIAR
ncbi:MAG: sulfurtransferase [Chloroflexota bacterium]|nr:sulfurtransferase [Dehalococcoidia bacterium]MDW8254896.1 sulfurtransferase [Chloroflexota bacterium]